MLQPGESERISRRGYAICVGIGTYTHLVNRNLRYAVDDATIMAERLADPQRGDFAMTVLTEPAQTTKAALEEAVKHLLSAPDRRAEDLALLYFSCHGDIGQTDHTFCLLPSNASLQEEGMYDPTALIGIYDFARWFASATVQNIVVFLDVCHSGGAGAALQHFTLKLDAGPNFFFIGAARQDQVTMQSSKLQHGLFTHCLLRAFEQPPTSDGWLTISQIHAFVSNEIPWFAKDQPAQIQSWSVAVDPNLPLLRNPGYPELCPLPPLWNVPLQRNVFFTGQEDLLSRLASTLQHEQKTALTQPHALSGLGGIGKTQLALEYAYRHRQDYHAVLWGRADTYEALISTFVSIAHLLDLPEADEPDQTIVVEAVKIWLRDRSQWLFILDNADDIALVKEFLPPAFRGHLLLTTRAQTMGKIVESKLEVEVMRPEIGALLLLRRARILATKASLEETPVEEVARAKVLAEELGGLPLALDQAGAYIEEAQCGLANYERLYQTRRAELLAHRGSLVDDHPESVVTTWSLSFEQVEQYNPAAAELLRLCAFLAPDAIPEELLAQGAEELGEVLAPVAADAYQLDRAIAALRAYSLISRNPQTRMLNIHRLVQVVLRDNMPAERQQQWIQRTVHAVAAAYPGLNFTNWPSHERLLPHALACATWVEQTPLATPQASRLLDLVGYYLIERARYAEAEPLLKRALAISEQTLGATHPNTATCLNSLAELYRAQGKYEQAELLYQRALAIDAQAISERAFKGSLLHLAQILNNLATLYLSQERYEEAEPLLKSALAIRERIWGDVHPNTLRSLINLSTLCKEQGRYEEAELLLKRGLTICEQYLGSSHPDTANSLNNLALLYQDQEEYAEAEPLLKRALAIREQQLGTSHPDTASSLHNLAWLYQNEGKYAQAEPLYVRALAIREQYLGACHPDMADSLNNLAMLYQDQKKYAQAEPLYVRALAIREQRLGTNHPTTANILNNLATLYQDHEKYAEAEPLFKRALAIREQQLGTGHPDIAQSLDNLAKLYQTQGKYVQAKPLYVRALAIREQQLGANHPFTANSLHGLANVYHKQGEYEQARTLYVRALAIREQQPEAEHSDTAIILRNLASLYNDQGNYAEAGPLYVRALVICEQQLGIGHPATVITRSDLAELYRVQEKYAEAEPLLKRALLVSEHEFGASHSDTVIGLNNLAALYRAQGRYEEAEPLYMRALAICDQQLDASYPRIQGILHNMALLYQAQGRYEEAEPLYMRALAICEQQLGPTHSGTANILNSLANLYNDQRKYTEAESLYMQALSIYEQRSGTISLKAMDSLNNLAVLYCNQGKYTEAEPLLVRALMISEQQLGDNHPNLVTCLNNLAELYQAQ